tara:strand:- start:483 stop:677 length:195 start_codon:yes stop_codon:yes gene_type:complete
VSDESAAGAAVVAAGAAVVAVAAEELLEELLSSLSLPPQAVEINPSTKKRLKDFLSMFIISSKD